MTDIKADNVVFIGFGIAMLASILMFLFATMENEIGVWLSGGVTLVVSILTMEYGGRRE